VEVEINNNKKKTAYENMTFIAVFADFEYLLLSKWPDKICIYIQDDSPKMLTAFFLFSFNFVVYSSFDFWNF